MVDPGTNRDSMNGENRGDLRRNSSASMFGARRTSVASQETRQIAMQAKIKKELESAILQTKVLDNNRYVGWIGRLSKQTDSYKIYNGFLNYLEKERTDLVNSFPLPKIAYDFPKSKHKLGSHAELTMTSCVNIQERLLGRLK